MICISPQSPSREGQRANKPTTGGSAGGVGSSKDLPHMLVTLFDTEPRVRCAPAPPGSQGSEHTPPQQQQRPLSKLSIPSGASTRTRLKGLSRTPETAVHLMRDFGGGEQQILSVTHRLAPHHGRYDEAGRQYGRQRFRRQNGRQQNGRPPPSVRSPSADELEWSADGVRSASNSEGVYELEPGRSYYSHGALPVSCSVYSQSTVELTIGGAGNRVRSSDVSGGGESRADDGQSEGGMMTESRSDDDVLMIRDTRMLRRTLSTQSV